MPSSSKPTVLVTGAKGCIGAWTIRWLIDHDIRVVALDLPGAMHRLEMILAQDISKITLLDGDILDSDTLLQTLQEHHISHIVHLAGLQVPACRARPTLGAQVNVVGTVNVFEAARYAGIKHIAYASSIAAYNPDMKLEPRTLYGVWKLANEGTARVYAQDYGISSIGLRPYTVYGIGRDFGLTSTPTAAMLSAAAGQNFHISYGGMGLYHLGADIGMIFARSALAEDLTIAAVFDPPGNHVHMREITAAIQATVPGSKITFDDTTLPFPHQVDTEGLAQIIGPIEITSIETGISSTIEGFRNALASGLVRPPEAAI